MILLFDLHKPRISTTTVLMSLVKIIKIKRARTDPCATVSHTELMFFFFQFDLQKTPVPLEVSAIVAHLKEQLKSFTAEMKSWQEYNRKRA